MPERYGEGGRTSLRLTGEIDITLPEDEAHLTGLEIQKEGAMVEDGALHLELQGPLAELRKLTTLHPRYGDALAGLAEDEERLATLRLVAEPDLVADLAEVAQELGEQWGPDDLLSDPVWASLAFSLHRYVPESADLAAA
jgi:hypothetical protein